jgi:hypothetical protein
MSYSVTIDIEPNNWSGHDQGRLISACCQFAAQIPVTRVRLRRILAGPPSVYEFRIDCLDDRTFKSSITNDDPLDPLIDIGFNTNVFRSSEHGHIRALRLEFSALLRAHLDLEEARYQL